MAQDLDSAPSKSTDKCNRNGLTMEVISKSLSHPYQSGSPWQRMLVQEVASTNTLNRRSSHVFDDNTRCNVADSQQSPFRVRFCGISQFFSTIPSSLAATHLPTNSETKKHVVVRCPVIPLTGKGRRGGPHSLLHHMNHFGAMSKS